MANQRKAGKKKLQVWMTEDERKRLDALTQAHGYDTVTSFLQAVANGTVQPAVRPPPASAPAPAHEP